MCRTWPARGTIYEPVRIPGGGYECSLEVPHANAGNCDKTFVEARLATATATRHSKVSLS